MDAPRHRVIRLRAQAPPKPATGQPCNGCGLCCLAEPCPLGVLISRRRHGRCAALRWQADDSRYVCDAVARPQAVWPRLPAPLRAVAARLARRWIASGIGCDADLAAAPGDPA